MATLRGADVIWDAATVNDGDVSDGSAIGAFSNVALFITADDTCDLVVQAAYNTSPVAGGNAMPTDDALWFDYLPILAQEFDASVTPNGISLAGDDRICVELSPFSPPYVRLKVVTAADVVVSAFVAAVG